MGGLLCCSILADISVHLSRSVVSNSLWPHGLQHTRLPCPSPTTGAYSNSCPSSQWCHQPSHPLSSPSPPALNLTQGLSQWVSSSHQVAKVLELQHQSIQFSLVTQSCPSLCDPMDGSTPGLPVHHQLPEFTQTHVHWVGDMIQTTHPLSSPSPPAHNLSKHQDIFKWVRSSHQVPKVLQIQL